jgi:hypothetical protein
MNRMNKDDAERFEQEKAMFTDAVALGDEDAAGAAVAAILQLELPLEVTVPFLLWDLTRDDK